MKNSTMQTNGIRIVLIGAGSAMFGLGTLGDIFKCKALEGSTIVLHDINPQALSKVEGIARKVIQERQLPYTLSATTSREQALQDATFCIISIEVGDRYKLWEQDWHIPLQYGIRQVYGENGGPGGLFHSLRIIPPILEICEDVTKICPHLSHRAPEISQPEAGGPMSRGYLTADAPTPHVGNPPVQPIVQGRGTQPFQRAA